MQKIAINQDALPLLRSSMALKDKILTTKAENYSIRLKKFEKKYKMKSSEFLKKFKLGKLGDNEEWFEWLFVYQAYSKILEQKKIIKGLVL
jgi:hypothetical protein